MDTIKYHTLSATICFLTLILIMIYQLFVSQQTTNCVTQPGNLTIKLKQNQNQYRLYFLRNPA